ncbi:MAG: hypothetical protein KL863_08855 [Rhizobium sp.]|nr:hypothetical protein [Rhizobium sp.]
MQDDTNPGQDRMFDELQELVAIEVKEILATASEEGFSTRDVVSALELALQAEIAALAAPAANRSDAQAGSAD